jgi:hypothetical protein
VQEVVERCALQPIEQCLIFEKRYLSHWIRAWYTARATTCLANRSKRAGRSEAAGRVSSDIRTCRETVWRFHSRVTDRLLALTSPREILLSEGGAAGGWSSER